MPLNSQQLKDLLTSRDTYTTTLLTLVVDQYGTECFRWSPETLVMELEEDFNIKLPSFISDRLQTGIAVMTTDDFYQNLPDFIQFCNVLSGDLYDPVNWDPANAEEIAWGITEALLLSPPEEANPFSEEITAYIGSVLDQEGIISPPDVLRIAVRDVDPANFVAGAFEEDPDMYAAAYRLQDEKTKAINSAVQTGLQMLLQQLESLPLKNGNSSSVKQMLLQLASQESDV